MKNGMREYGLRRVLWTGNIGVPQAVTTTSTGKHSYGLMSLEEPVDSASGAYLDAAIDLKLGGPMGLSFMRYYSSDLWTSGLQSALGVNWMHNFDSVLKVSGTSANVLLFGGRAVTFQKSGGAWQLQAPTDVAYQLAQNGFNYQLLDPTDRRIYTYSAAGLLTKNRRSQRATAITVTQGPFGPATVSDGLGRTLTFTYSNGQLTNVQDQTKRSMTYLYSGRDLAGFLDDAGRTTRYTNTTVTGQEALISLDKDAARKHHCQPNVRPHRASQFPNRWQRKQAHRHLRFQRRSHHHGFSFQHRPPDERLKWRCNGSDRCGRRAPSYRSGFVESPHQW